MAGKCIQHTSAPDPLIDLYTAPIPSSLLDDAPVSYIFPTYKLSASASYSYENAEDASYHNAAYSTFLDEAYSSFKQEEGYEGCTATVPPSQFYPTFIGELVKPSGTAQPSATPTNGSATAISLATSTEGSAPVRRLHSTQTIIISVVVSTVGLIVLLLCFIVIRRYRKKRSQAALSNNQPAMTSNTQLYVDQKAELEAEERRKHELEAYSIRYEMEGEDSFFEMPGDGNPRMGLASFNRTHELRGTEHSKELEVPGNA